MTIHDVRHHLLLHLYKIYAEGEAASIADLVIEYVTGYRETGQRLLNDLPVTEQQEKQINGITKKLLQHTPVQYAINESWFAGMKLYVDENVLIPRPETEELVDWITGEVKSKKVKGKKVIDIGTGSGCIPLALKKKIPEAIVRAMDISEGALHVATRNARMQAVQVYFIRMDFLDEQSWKQLGKFDIIVSNPPYIRLSEAGTMDQNVLQYEPHLALFVPDDDALLFYKKIAAFGKEHLEVDGSIFLEINEALGTEITDHFEKEGYKIELKKDMQGKDRMIRASKKN